MQNTNSDLVQLEYKILTSCPSPRDQLPKESLQKLLFTSMPRDNVFAFATIKFFFGTTVAPAQILSQGGNAKVLYVKALRDGAVNVYRGRILFIGQDRAGKTSLKKSLLGLPFDVKEESTEGIEVDPSMFEIEVDRIKNWRSSRENKPGLSEFSKDIARMLAEKRYHAILSEVSVSEEEDEEGSCGGGGGGGFGDDDDKDDDEDEEEEEEEEEEEGEEKPADDLMNQVCTFLHAKMCDFIKFKEPEDLISSFVVSRRTPKAIPHSPSPIPVSRRYCHPISFHTLSLLAPTSSRSRPARSSFALKCPGHCCSGNATRGL